MFHKIVLMIVFSFAVGLVGCRSCWGPYDRCQPTFVPEAGDECMGELYRNGSILGGMERRGNCSSCSSCAGGISGMGYDAGYGYYDTGYSYGEGYAEVYDQGTADRGVDGGIAPQGVWEYSEAGAVEPLPNTAPTAEPSETIPTPSPSSAGKGSIRDFLPDPTL